MTIQHQQCDDLPLELLLAEDDGSGEYREMTDHIGQCETCRTRLDALAADPGFWSDSRELLRGREEITWKPDASWSSALAFDDEPRQRANVAAALAQLATPRHPEMLGRLGRYDIERVVGSGGMGIVLKAHDSELNRPIAVKLLAAHLAHVGAARERFAREGRAAAAVVHEHVVAIYNVESDGEVPFLVMQFVPGQSLQARVDEAGPLGVEEILRIGMQAASGLAAAHAQGLVHRDVKPSNILLENTLERVVLTDFGLARAVDDASLTQTGVLAGTPHYMSPEQATGQAIDHRSDLFGLGAVMYFMATGHPPFRADGALAVLNRICSERHRPVWQINKDIPDELSDVIDRLLEKKSGRRFADATEVKTRLSTLLSHMQQYGYRPRRWSALRRKSTAFKVAWGAAAVALLALAATVAALPRIWPRTDAPPAPTASTGADEKAALVEPSKQFASDFAEAQSKLDDADQPTAFIERGDSSWYDELRAIDQAISILESTK
jgi:eukaryotic-like serine/threonine-protein kinase